LLDLKAPAAQPGLFVAHAQKERSAEGGMNAAVSPAYLQTMLTRPLPTKDGGTLRTVAEARAYMLSTTPS
jgi:hypothetical protein